MKTRAAPFRDFELAGKIDKSWGCSSAGRAPRSQRGGQRFDPAQLHQIIHALNQRFSRGERLPQSISKPISQPESSHPALLPLCVDLDGTLVKSDTLVDSLLALLRTHPALAFRLPGRLLRGKAAFKAFLSESISLDVAHL